MIKSPFQTNDYQVIDSYWFNHIGIVKIATSFGEFKYYIGQGKGLDQQEDEQIIAQTGTPVSPSHLKAFFQW